MVVSAELERHRIDPPRSFILDLPMSKNGWFKINVRERRPSGYRQVEMFIIVSDGAGWEHASVSFSHRCPTWEEMCQVRRLLWAPEDLVVQYHPPESEYVNGMPTCLHLWRSIDQIIPSPPKELVGWDEQFIAELAKAKHGV